MSACGSESVQMCMPVEESVQMCVPVKESVQMCMPWEESVDMWRACGGEIVYRCECLWRRESMNM